MQDTVFDSECSSSRFAKSKKTEFTLVNEDFFDERKAENGHYGQTLIGIKKPKTISRISSLTMFLIISFDLLQK